MKDKICMHNHKCKENTITNARVWLIVWSFLSDRSDILQLTKQTYCES